MIHKDERAICKICQQEGYLKTMVSAKLAKPLGRGHYHTICFLNHRLKNGTIGTGKGRKATMQSVKHDRIRQSLKLHNWKYWG